VPRGSGDEKQFPLRRLPVSLLVIVGLAFAGGSWPTARLGRASATPEGVLVARPARLASTTEVPNPDRGSYLWQDASPQPAGWPIQDSYLRFLWRDLEPTAGHYDFGVIDRALAAAAARGGRLGIRIQAACTGCANPSIAVPDYLKAQMPRGFWFDLHGTRNYAPDWNDPDYLGRLSALLDQLGRRYDHDPRLGWVDISSYGDWGEWHVSGWPYPSPTGATPITTANAERIVRMNVAAFPDKRLLMQHQTTVSDGDDHVAFLYALDHYPSIGIRNDCLGDPWFTEEMTYLYKKYPVVANRWKTAPVMTELCGGGFSAAGMQIAKFHVANLGNGNFGSLAGYSRADRARLEHDNIISGYRFALVGFTMPSSVSRTNSFDVRSRWSNTGVTPAYEPWNVTFELRVPTTGRIVWTGKSNVDLRAELPTGNGSSVTADEFTLGSRVPQGTYTVAVTVLDPARSLRPLALAMPGRTPAGAYLLGSISVR
jgi:hypothetical protein